MSSKAQRLRAAWDYDDDTPRCATCSGYRKPALREHMPRQQAIAAATCGKGGFPIKATGCCDKWTERNTGERLQRQEDHAP